MATAEALITAEEYLRMADNDKPTELVRGRIIEMSVPTPRHGQVCGKVVRIVGNFADEGDMGHVVCNNSGVVVERNPDTVRCPDVAFYSYHDVPKGPLPNGYLDKAPRLVLEVLSPEEHWNKMHAKVAEFLSAGVQIVCVFDLDEESAFVYSDDKGVVIQGADSDLTFASVLPDFCVPVKRFFE